MWKIIATIFLLFFFNSLPLHAEEAKKGDEKTIEIDTKKAVEKTGKALKKAGQKTGDVLEKAAEKTSKGLKKAGEAIKKAGKKIKEHVSVEKDEDKK